MDGLVRQLAIGVGWDVDDSGLVEADESTDGLVDTTEDAESSMDGLSQSGEGAGNILSRSFDSFTDKIGSGIERLEEMKFMLGGLAAAGGAAIFGFVGQAGDLEERLNTLNREFGNSADAVEDWARSYADATELTEMQLVDWSATLGVNFRMLDMTSDQTANLTQEMIELTHNYAHFMDMEPEQAFQSIHQAIRGGRFPRALRDLTGQVRQTDIETRALNEGLIEQGEEMDSQAERIATLSLLQEELAITQGAADDGQEEWNTQMIRFRGILRDTSSTIGDVFRPTMARGLTVVNDFLTTIRENRLLRIGAGFAGLTTGVLALGAGIGFAATAFSKLSSLIGVAAGALGIAKAPLVLLTALVVGLGLVLEDLWVGFQGGESRIFQFVEWMGEALGITEELQAGFEGFKDGIMDIWNSLVTFGSGIISIFSGLGQIIWGFLTFDTDMMLSGFEELKEGISLTLEGIVGVIYGIGGGIVDAVNWIFWNTLQGIWSLTTSLGANIFNSVSWLIETTWNTIVDKIQDWTGIELPEINLPRWPEAREYISEKWNQFTGWLDGLKERYLPSINLPAISDIRGAVENKWDDFTSWLGDLSPTQVLSDTFAGFGGWLPEMPDLIGGFRDWWSGNTVTEWVYDNINPTTLLTDTFAGFSDWLPEFPNLIEGIQDWWGGVGEWVDENLSFSGLVEGAADTAGGISETVGGWLGGDDDSAEETISTQTTSKKNVYNNTVNVSEIKVEAADDPEETGRAIRKELETYLNMQGAEAGVDG